MIRDKIPDFSAHKAVVIVFVQPGCPACHEYLPRIGAVSKPYDGCLLTVVVDVSKPMFADLVKHFDVRATPTTIGFVRGRAPVVLQGAIEQEVVERLYTGHMIRGLMCDV